MYRIIYAGWDGPRPEIHLTFDDTVAEAVWAGLQVEFIPDGF